MNNKEIQFNGDDLIKSVESLVDFCQQNPAFVNYINNRLEKSESTPISIKSNDYKLSKKNNTKL